MKSAADRSAGALAVLAGCLSLREAYRLYPYHVSQLGGDHTFPAFIGAGLALAGIWLVLFPGPSARSSSAGLTAPETAEAETASADTTGEKHSVNESIVNGESFTGTQSANRTSGRFPFLPGYSLIPLLLLIYTVILPRAGYLAGTFVIALLLFRVLGIAKWWRCAVYALLLTAGLYLVFIEWLHTPFSAGTLWLHQGGD
ncbi:tripartite tricarboxylate transporter TctB family protein [Paenibacillus sp. 7124]|uniref:Tripartite tricarboxylate transporter TctB family protein n=1 Tax=Paenibacillus apii TaxID=1850370 RepID=A0A6M1PMM3_9BACL|nr:tripartite tricarboxylate transporter TctB family protein [Paenibacillus apii]NGM83718.1 tripartite tricarboxylate transporter TctB family protein [Paenibacillus apii]NJJ41177.1 tripartite tricarboxylate transporter TctB family protein [Paenibacillus apii]